VGGTVRDAPEKETARHCYGFFLLFKHNLNNLWICAEALTPKSTNYVLLRGHI
jgi:hypothetical protein